MVKEIEPGAEDLEKARCLLDNGPLCLSCLGRFFARRGHGLTNRHRGEVLLQELDGYFAVEPGDCSVCQGLMDDVDELVEAACRAVKGYEFSTFLVGTKVSPDLLAGEERRWNDCDIKDQETMKNEFNREVGKALEEKFALEGYGREAGFDHPEVMIIIDTSFLEAELQVKSVYLFGRYRKLDRGIPQTRWPCRRCHGYGCDHCGGTGKMYPTSVEEEVAGPVMPRTKGKEHAFHGLGREDIDARMLGNGRPFVLEVKSPRIRTIDVSEVEKEINSCSENRVEVSDLALCGKDMVKFVKSVRVPKSYRVSIKITEKVGAGKLEKALGKLIGPIPQRTPNRVSHRRGDLVRKREVFDTKLSRLDENGAELEIKGEAGLYVKELMHGDQGRTEPSLASLLDAEVEVKVLDVVHIWDQDIDYSKYLK